MMVKKARKALEESEHEAISVISGLQALVAGAEHFNDHANVEPDAKEHLCASLRLIRLQLDELRRVIWGEDRGP
jgi:hypothetical protein